jgi:hypothetical protein
MCSDSVKNAHVDVIYVHLSVIIINGCSLCKVLLPLMENLPSCAITYSSASITTVI